RGVARLLRADVATIVSSFDPAMLLHLRALAPEMPRALLVHKSGNEGLVFAGAALAGTRAGADALHIDHRIVTAATIARLRRRGYVVGVWTVNDSEAMRAFADLDVDLLITDRPALALAAL